MIDVGRSQGELSVSRKQPRDRSGLWLLWPGLIILGAISLYPTVDLVRLALTNANVGSQSTDFVGAHNFVQAVTDPLFGQGLLHTAEWTVLAVGMEVVLGVLIAWLLSLALPWARKIALPLLIIPVAAPSVAIAFVWDIILDPTIGVANYLLKLVGLHGVDWLGNSHLTLFSLMAIDIWKWTPFIALIVYAGFGALPNDPIEAAQVDGAGLWRRFLAIELPMLRPFVITALALRVIGAFKEFTLIFVLTAGGPGNASLTANLYIFRELMTYFNSGYASALAIIMLVVAVVVSQVLLRRGGLIGAKSH